MEAEKSCNERSRLAALAAYEILDTPREADFDDLAALAAAVFATPIAVVNLIDRDRQWFKADVGLGVRETPLATSFCAHAILEEDLMVVPDALNDYRFTDNPLVTEDPGLRFYAGSLLKTPEGEALGTLCVLDYESREFNDAQRDTLRVLADQVMAQLETRRLLRETRQSRRELLAANEQLSLEGERKSDFMAVLAHELRGPLSPVATAADILTLNGGERFQNCSRVLKCQTSQMSALIDGLLDAARARRGALQLELEETALGAMVDQAVRSVSHQVEARQLALDLEVGDGPVLVDRERMVGALSILLANAARFTPTAGHIGIYASTGRDLRIEVRDDGAGIDAGALPELSEQLQDAPGNNQSSRMGVGLSLVRTLVEAHGGAVHASGSGECTGNRFELVIPQSGVQRHDD